jgi:predicted Zn-dependent protease
MVALSQTALKDNPKGGYIMAALGLGSMVGISLPYGRMQESEADEVGQILMAKAGYDPAESIQFWSRFAQATGGSGAPTFLSTHPSSAGRAENMQDKLSHARTEYEKAPNKYGLGESF